MDKKQVGEQIKAVGIIPVVRAASAEEAMLAVDAVCAGGITTVEITMTVPGAIEIIRKLSASRGSQVIVGAGTVLDPESARRCMDAGAQFIVSPAFCATTIEAAAKRGILMMSGALTPTEIVTAWRSGSDFVKVFPCGQIGGAAYIRALRGPLPQIPLVPTGGVNLNTAADFIAAGSIALGVGGELVQAAAMKAHTPNLITEAARKFVEIVQQARGRILAVR